jgi:hypothetical protein
MTTQPQSPSEQEIRTQVENAIAPPVEELAESGWPNDSFKKAVDDVLVLITQAADKREQEVLEWAERQCVRQLHNNGYYECMYKSQIADRLAQLRQGRAAEGKLDKPQA